MAEKKKGKDVITPEFRAAFPTVFEAKVNRLAPNKPATFSIVMLFPKSTDLSALKEIRKQAVIDKWGEDPTKWPKNLRDPIRDGDAQQNWDGYAGCFFVRAETQIKPAVVGINKGPDGKLLEITDRSKVYGGMYARAQISAWAYAHQSGNNGVSFNLLSLQVLRAGEPFASRSDPDKAFPPVEGATEGTAEDPKQYATDDPFAGK